MWNMSVHTSCLKLLLILLFSQGILVTDWDPVVLGGVCVDTHGHPCISPVLTDFKFQQ